MFPDGPERRVGPRSVRSTADCLVRRAGVSRDAKGGGDYRDRRDWLIVLQLSTGKELAAMRTNAWLPTIGTIFPGMHNDVLPAQHRSWNKRWNDQSYLCGVGRSVLPVDIPLVEKSGSRTLFSESAKSTCARALRVSACNRHTSPTPCSPAAHPPLRCSQLPHGPRRWRAHERSVRRCQKVPSAHTQSSAAAKKDNRRERTVPHRTKWFVRCSATSGGQRRLTGKKERQAPCSAFERLPLAPRFSRAPP